MIVEQSIGPVYPDEARDGPIIDLKGERLKQMADYDRHQATLGNVPIGDWRMELQGHSWFMVRHYVPRAPRGQHER